MPLTPTSGSTAVCIRGEHPRCANAAHCRCDCHRRPCPDFRLHQVAESPLRPLSDLLKAASDIDEIADNVRDHADLTVEEARRFEALRVAVRRLAQ